MCLGIPAKIVSIDDSTPLLKQGLADFGGITKTISLAYTPEVIVGQYVLVHVGFAMTVLDEAAALEHYELLKRL